MTMTTPLWMLLAFAMWTVLLLLATVGMYRWSRILTGRVPIREFRADKVEGEDWYKRAMRAHANCVENLPVFAVIVLALQASGTGGYLVDDLCITIMAARMIQSLIHVSVPQTNGPVSVRFSFYFIQLICFLWLALIIISDNL